MHQRTTALFASFAVTCLVMLVGWKLAFSSFTDQSSPVRSEFQALAPPALQTVSTTTSGTLVAGETIASR